MLALLDRPATLTRAALASLVANIAIVGTGGLVRVSDSGLGCPTWPRCTDNSYHATPAMGIHGAIEFGNRLLTFVLGAIAVIGLLAAYRQRHRVRAALRPAVLIFVGVALQGLLGGVTVRMALNPWTVAAHFLLSMGLIAVSYAFWRTATTHAARWTAPAPARTLALLLTGVSAVVLVLGTVVTGSGPHAGDAAAARTGFDPESVAQLHTDVVFLLLGLSVAMWFTLRALGAPPRASRAAATLVLVELGQGMIGFVQYVTGLPWAAVVLHMLGACLVWLAALHMLATVRADASEAAPGPAADQAELVAHSRT